MYATVPISLFALWEQPYQEPIYLVTNMSDLDAAVAQYKKRGHIETFFSDQKSRGFNIDKSHLSDPVRLPSSNCPTAWGRRATMPATSAGGPASFAFAPAISFGRSRSTAA